MAVTTSSARRMASRLAIAITGVAAATAIAAGVVSVMAARTIVVPPARSPENLRIRRVDLDAGRIVLESDPDSRLPGQYGLWFASGTGYARLGEILDSDNGSVTRRLVAVDRGDITRARHGRLSGWMNLEPGSLGFPFEDVAVRTELGDAPAWHFPVPEPTGRWVIQVHGRAVRRHEALRAVPVFRACGYDSLLISYRNDGEAPKSPDHRFALGATEWRDVEAAMRFALERGAREFVLMGWSMGGATVLQTVANSPLARHVTGLVLDSPVVDWITTLDFQAALRRLPHIVRLGAFALLGSRLARRLTGLAEPLDLRQLDFVARAAELSTPILLLHSDDDGFVPVTASRALAQARPDIVRLEEFHQARHTKLWNYDPARWEGAIRDWLASLPTRQRA